MTATRDTLAADMQAHGIRGYVAETDGEFYIPVVIARWPGHGDCGRWLDSLPTSVTIKVPGVLNPVLAGMLERRGFAVCSEWAPEPFGEWVEVYRRDAS